MSDDSATANAVPGTFDQLVHQFADPMAFLRELLQNSIDAGSAVVEVRCELREGEGEKGVLIISVDDWGEGMDRQIIDKRLTRLFSSDKAGDRTKIGKFGIGFVSVFGIQPDAVCVDTARGGERWRVLFRGDRSFTRVRLDEPLEGTKVRVIKNIRADDYADYERRVRTALLFWCQHVEIELRYQGERIDKPLQLGATVEVRDDGPLGSLCVGIASSSAPARGGFYNRGLALLDQPSEWQGIAYKINSSRLAHTLSRDQVVKDEAYYKLIGRVEALIGSLMTAVLLRLEELLSTDALIGEWEPLQQWLLLQRSADLPLPSDFGQRCIARSPQGVLLSFDTCQAAARNWRLFFAPQPSQLVVALESQGCVVVLHEGKSEALLRTLIGQAPVHIERQFFLPLPLSDVNAQLGWLPLAKAAQALLFSHSNQSVEVHLGQFGYSGSNTPGWVAAVQQQPFSISRFEDARRPPKGPAWQQQKLLINVDHPTVQTLGKVALEEPEWAAYTLLKLFHLGVDLTAALDGALLKAATLQRSQRVRL